MTKHGTEAFLKYLREHPDLVARIQAGELNAESAALAAGFDLTDLNTNHADETVLEDHALERVAGGTDASSESPSTAGLVMHRGRLMCTS